MRPRALDEGLRWLRQAEQDVSDALYAREGNRHNLACFLSQQAAEKALKGYLYAQGLEAPWGHSASELCDAAAEFDVDFGAIKRSAAALDKYYIPTRYPNGLPGGIPAEAFDSGDSERALSFAEQVVGLVSEKLKDLLRG